MDIAQQAGLLVPHDLPRGTVRAMAEHGHVEIGYRDEITTRMLYRWTQSGKARSRAALERYSRR